MKALDWHKYLVEQKERTGKTLFSVSELCNVGAASPQALNLALARLTVNGIITRYARGWYGLPGQVSIDQLVKAIDPGAYITGAAALARHGLITQVPMQTICFTNRRYNRSRERQTPLGTLAFACVQRPIYDPPGENSVCASAVQALFDFVYMCRRGSVDPRSQVTFHKISTIDSVEISRLAERYPLPVQSQVKALIK